MEKKESSLTYLSYGSIMLSAIQTGWAGGGCVAEASAIRGKELWPAKG